MSVDSIIRTHNRSILILENGPFVEDDILNFVEKYFEDFDESDTRFNYVYSITDLKNQDDSFVFSMIDKYDLIIFCTSWMYYDQIEKFIDMFSKVQPKEIISISEPPMHFKPDSCKHHKFYYLRGTEMNSMIEITCKNE